MKISARGEITADTCEELYTLLHNMGFKIVNSDLLGGSVWKSFINSKDVKRVVYSHDMTIDNRRVWTSYIQS